MSTTYNAQCKCCVSTQREAIDTLLLSGCSLRDTAERCNVSATSVHRHLHHHLGEDALIAAQVRREVVGLVRDVMNLMMRKPGTRDVAQVLRDLGLRAADQVPVHDQPAEPATAAPSVCPHCGSSATRAIGQGCICYSCGLDWSNRP